MAQSVKPSKLNVGAARSKADRGGDDYWFSIDSFQRD